MLDSGIGKYSEDRPKIVKQIRNNEETTPKIFNSPKEAHTYLQGQKSNFEAFENNYKDNFESLPILHRHFSFSKDLYENYLEDKKVQNAVYATAAVKLLQNCRNVMMYTDYPS